MSKTRILIADDHEIARLGLQLLLSDNEAFELCDPQASPAAVMAFLENDCPDLLILDLHLPPEGGLSILEFISRKSVKINVLVVSGLSSGHAFQSALELGASGLVSKTEPGEVMLEAIHAVLDGERYISPGIGTLIGDLAEDGNADSNAQLTRREKEVLTLVAEGHSNTAISQALGISPTTVKKHRENMMRKLNVSSAVDATRRAYELGLVNFH